MIQKNDGAQPTVMVPVDPMLTVMELEYFGLFSNIEVHAGKAYVSVRC